MKSILITGASSGIGAACARAFAAAGWHVGAMARRQQPLEDLATEHASIDPIVGDVTDLEAVENAVAQTAAKSGRLDVLFNNAGIFTPAGPIDEVDIEDWHKAVGVNLTGMFYAARAAFGQMRHQSPQGGRIINNGSVSAHVPRPGAVTYTTTKHAITGLTRQLSLDGRAFDIACGQIDIGNALTPMVQAMNDKLLAEDANAELQPSMSVDDAVTSVLHMAGLPISANVQFMTVMATKMPYIGRG